MENIEINQSEIEKIEQELRNATPLYASNEEALEVVTSELNQLASKYNKSVEELIIAAEESSVYNDDYFKALSLDRKIAFLSK